MSEDKTILENKISLLKEEVSTLQKQLNIISETSKKIKKLQVCSGAVLFCVFAVFIFGLYSKISHFDTVKMQEIILKDIKRDLPLFTSKIVQMSERVIPVYAKQLAMEVEQVRPEFLNLIEKETTEFINYVEKETVNKVRKGVMDALESQKGVIYTMVPELKEEDNVILLAENLRQIIQTALLNVAVDKFESHIKAMEGIDSSLNELRNQFKGREESDVEVKLMAVTLEMIGKKLGEDIENIKK